jgi:hypothetical protein
MEVGGQLHAPATLPPRKRAPSTHWIGGWVGPRTGLDKVPKRKIPRPHQELNIDHPIRIQKLQPQSLGYYGSKLHKSWFDKECSKLPNQRKQDKQQWLQNSSQINGDNFNNIRCKTKGTFRNRKKGMSGRKTNKYETNSKNKNIRCINEFKKGYQPTTKLVRDENSDLLADSHNILNRWNNYFCQLLKYMALVAQLHNDELQNLYSSPDIIRVIKSRSMK